MNKFYKSKLNYINDQMIINSFENNNIIKFAGFDSDFFNSVKKYFENQIDPNNKVGSIINLLAPGSLAMTISRLGFPKLGFFLGTVVSVLGIDLGAIYSKVFNLVINLIKSNNATENEVESIITSTISSENSEISEQELKNLEQLSKLSNFKNRDSLILNKLNKQNLNKFAAKSNIKLKALTLIGKVLYYFFTAALAALGINVAGNVIKKIMDKPNAFDNNDKKNEISESKQKEFKYNLSLNTSTQNVFPKNPSYSDNQYNSEGFNWIENYSNTTNGISKMLLDFTKQVYSGVENLDTLIKNNPSFNIVLNYIEDYNIDSVGDNTVFIPKKYKSKKQIVDQFIDDVAHSSKK